MLQRLRENFTGRAAAATAGAVMAATAFIAPAPAAAQNVEPTTATVSAPQDAAIRGLEGGYDESSDYAESLQGIGVTIFWGEHQKADFTKEELAGWITGGFLTAKDAQGEPVQSQVNFETLYGRSHSTIRFHVGPNVTAPLLVEDFIKEPLTYMRPMVSTLNLERRIGLAAAGPSLTGG